MQPVPPELLAVETSDKIHLAHSVSADGVHLRVLHSKGDQQGASIREIIIPFDHCVDT
mgnify:CR=1 FL=1